MNNKFATRLQKYLESECFDYDLIFWWTWNEDGNYCEVTILRDDFSQYTKEVKFKYNEKDNDLLIELSEDSYYVTREFDETVKYFWMVISPTIFRD